MHQDVDRSAYPTNRNFGLFFSLLFTIMMGWGFHTNSVWIILISLILSGIFLLLGVLDSELLTPLNLGWTRIGLTLGKIVNPLVMAIIFFGLICPYAIVTRFGGRDELRIRSIRRNLPSSFWAQRENSSTDFTKQF